MNKPVTIHVAKTTLSQLIHRVEAGEDVVIARGSKPVARLVPIADQRTPRVFGAMRGTVSVDASFFDALPDDELEGWNT